MPPEKHALLGASGAHRWLNCPPSARLEEKLPEETSVYAEEGRLAHAVAELKLRKQFTEPMGPRKFNTALKELQQHPLYQAEMLTHADTYLVHVNAVVHAYNAPPHIALERQLDYSHNRARGLRYRRLRRNRRRDDAHHGLQIRQRRAGRGGGQPRRSACMPWALWHTTDCCTTSKSST